MANFFEITWGHPTFCPFSQNAEKFEDKDLENRCWEVIELEADQALRSDDFVTVERSLVESVVKGTG